MTPPAPRKQKTFLVEVSYRSRDGYSQEISVSRCAAFDPDDACHVTRRMYAGCLRLRIRRVTEIGAVANA